MKKLKHIAQSIELLFLWFEYEILEALLWYLLVKYLLFTILKTDRYSKWAQSLKIDFFSQQTVELCNITTQFLIYGTSIQSVDSDPSFSSSLKPIYDAHFQWLLYSPVFIPLHPILSLRCFKLSKHTNLDQLKTDVQERKNLIMCELEF